MLNNSIHLGDTAHFNQTLFVTKFNLHMWPNTLQFETSLNFQTFRVPKFIWTYFLSELLSKILDVNILNSWIYLEEISDNVNIKELQREDETYSFCKTLKFIPKACINKFESIFDNIWVINVLIEECFKFVVVLFVCALYL